MTTPNEDFLETVPGAIVQFVVDEMLKFDMASTAWHNLPDDARTERLEKMRDRAESLAQQIVNVVVTDGAESVEAYVEQVVFKDDVKIVAKCSKNSPTRHAIADSAGQPVLIVIPQLAMNFQMEYEQDQLSLNGEG